MIRRKPDPFELASFMLAFYILAGIVVVGLLAILPSIVEFLVSP